MELSYLHRNKTVVPSLHKQWLNFADQNVNVKKKESAAAVAVAVSILGLTQVANMNLVATKLFLAGQVPKSSTADHVLRFKIDVPDYPNIFLYS